MDRPASPIKKARVGTRNSTRQPETVRPVKPAGPSRASPRPVLLTKTKKTCTIFLISLPPHTAPRPQTPHCDSSSRLSSLCHTHTRFSSTHVAAGHQETRWPPRRRWPYPLLLHRDIHHRTLIGGRFRPPRPPRRQVCS